jgi:peroxiredoxin Q/BCP
MVGIPLRVRGWWLLGLAGLMLGSAPAPLRAEAGIAPGQAAPDFSLMDQSGATRTLAAYRGRWIVLYFYPKDDTPGCTTEACQFRDDFASIQKLGAAILGVSIDSRESHAEFARKYHLPFPLLADTDGAVAKQYGALWGAWPLRFARRHTFLIDPAGRIARIYREVDPQNHSREIMADLAAAQRPGAKSP